MFHTYSLFFVFRVKYTTPSDEIFYTDITVNGKINGTNILKTYLPTCDNSFVA